MSAGATAVPNSSLFGARLPQALQNWLPSINTKARVRRQLVAARANPSQPPTATAGDPAHHKRCHNLPQAVKDHGRVVQVQLVQPARATATHAKQHSHRLSHTRGGRCRSLLVQPMLCKPQHPPACCCCYCKLCNMDQMLWLAFLAGGHLQEPTHPTH